MGSYMQSRIKEANRVAEDKKIMDVVNRNSVKPAPATLATTPLSDEEYRKTTGRQRNSSTLLGG